MPFDTPEGPAVLIENICNIDDLAERLEVRVNTVYNWINNRERNGFPRPFRSYVKLRLYDYLEVYEWFEAWVRTHPRSYPVAYKSLTENP